MGVIVPLFNLPGFTLRFALYFQYLNNECPNTETKIISFLFSTVDFSTVEKSIFALNNKIFCPSFERQNFHNLPQKSQLNVHIGTFSSRFSGNW